MVTKLFRNYIHAVYRGRSPFMAITLGPAQSESYNRINLIDKDDMGGGRNEVNNSFLTIKRNIISLVVNRVINKI